MTNSDYLEGKLKEFEEAITNHKHQLAWKLINDVTGRKMSRGGRIKGNTKVERLHN